MQTAQRGAQRPAPGNVTGRRFAEQQREQDARKRAEEAGPIDVEAVKREARAEGFNAGWDRALEWVAREYGLDGDEPGDEVSQ